ncbi:MAG: hypothetical protein HKO54_07465 [Flavobacteriaceae bacterium]|nr:hypothetical protein [Flavobacteriaceae bacterium]
MRIALLLFFFSSFIYAQQLELVSKKPLEVDRFVGLDSYGHTYFILQGVLHKQGELGDFVFQDLQLGAIGTIDLINPLNVVVFYAEVNTVVFLDNRLNEKERVNFNNLPNFINISSITNAGNNRLWLFNMDTQQLQLFNYRNQRETVFSQPYEGSLIDMVSDFNDCFLLTEDYLWQVNIYGSQLSEVQLSGFERIVRSGKKVIGLKENKLYFIQPEAVIPLELDLDENPIKDLQLTQEFLYIYDGKFLSTFTLTQPK